MVVLHFSMRVEGIIEGIYVTCHMWTIVQHLHTFHDNVEHTRPKVPVSAFERPVS